LNPHRNQNNHAQAQQQQSAAPAGGDVEMNGWDDTPLASGAATPTTNGKTSHLSDVTFDSLKGTVDDRVLKNVKFSNMTTVQVSRSAQPLWSPDPPAIY
jgi:hypothetical protein